jgi:hypothetical protein
LKTASVITVISFNPEPTATAGRHLLGWHVLGDRLINEMMNGDKSAVAAGSGLNYVGQIDMIAHAERRKAAGSLSLSRM